MLHTVVIDAEALTALDQLFITTGKPLPRSDVVERAHARAWHAVPIDEASITAIQNLRTANDEPFNDTLRRMLDLPPLALAIPRDQQTPLRPEPSAPRPNQRLRRSA